MRHQVAVTVDQGFGEAMPEEGDERHHGLALLIRPRVAGFALLVETAYVADAYAVRIRRLAMTAYKVYRLPDFYRSIEVDDVVIAAIGAAGGRELTFLVPVGDVYIGDQNYHNHPFWDWVSDNYQQVLVVPGNHEFYKYYDLSTISY